MGNCSCGTKRFSEFVFDSRKGTKVYGKAKYKYYRSSIIKVAGGQEAIVELIAGEDIMTAVTFGIVRVPSPIIGDHCWKADCLGKWFRKGKVCVCGDKGRDLGTLETAGGNGGQLTPYFKNIVRIGIDKANGNKIFEWAVIDRPGTYYLVAEKCHNEIIANCRTPIIVESTIYDK